MVAHDDIVAGNVPDIGNWKLNELSDDPAVAYERTPAIEDLPFDAADWPHGLDKLLVRAELKVHTGFKDEYLVVIYESDPERGMLSPIYRATAIGPEEGLALLRDVLADYDESRETALERGENLLSSGESP